MAASERQGDWIQTFLGHRFWPLDPRPDEIYLEDIAHALSLQCRFAGHVRAFYSVGQHSIHVSYEVAKVKPVLAFAGLFHDAAEAYLQDVIRPLKRLPLFEAYRQAEERLLVVIGERFDVSGLDAPEIKEADARMLITEKRDLCTPCGVPWGPGQGMSTEPYDWTIIPWSARTTEVRFLERFAELTARRTG